MIAMKNYSAESDSTERIEPAIRYLTVSGAGNPPKQERIPTLILRGKWLEEAGFPIGTMVDVWVRYGSLVLTARKVHEQELEKLAALAELDALASEERVLMVE